MTAFLDFEKQVAALDRQIAELREMGDDPSLNIDGDVARLEAKSAKMLREIYAKLTPWQKTQVARHPDRPHFKHYVAGLFDDWMPLAGDRNFGDDQAMPSWCWRRRPPGFHASSCRACCRTARATRSASSG